jgi:hypothetical protein
MKILLAYGSAMARIDDMKLFGGVSGGRTGGEILQAVHESGEWDIGVTQSGHSFPKMRDHDLRILVSSTAKHPHWPGWTKTFKTWQEYQNLLYEQCVNWQPDAVICAVAVSNYTPTYVVENQNTEWPLAHSPCVQGKIDSRKTERLLIEMKRTPNIINGVRDRIGKDAVLVGFKLTSEGDEQHMLDFARKVIKDAQADMVVANDLKLGLDKKWLVTQVGQQGPVDASRIIHVAADIHRAKSEGFYRTRAVTHTGDDKAVQTFAEAHELWGPLSKYMNPHGTLAVRAGSGFVTTTRGKKTLQNLGLYDHPASDVPLTTVISVDHDKREVSTELGPQLKATLNAPLLDRMFKNHPDIKVIVHLHRYLKKVGTVAYRVPGTVAEASLGDSGTRAFNIAGHGCIASFTTTDMNTIMKWVEDPTNWT